MSHFTRFVATAAALTVLILTVTVSAATGERVKPIDAKFACFINKQKFDKPQMPVVVDGKTYYGCCQSCAQTLTSDPKSRMDTDPVSGKRVDKATAVVGADKAGTVYFFENMKNLKKFRVD